MLLKVIDTYPKFKEFILESRRDYEVDLIRLVSSDEDKPKLQEFARQFNEDSDCKGLTVEVYSHDCMEGSDEALVVYKNSKAPELELCYGSLIPSQPDLKKLYKESGPPRKGLFSQLSLKLTNL